MEKERRIEKRGRKRMEELVRSVNSLRKSPVARKVRQRMEEFHRLGSAGADDLFKELCFCILTANYSAEGGIRIQKKVGDGFLTLDEVGLASRLRQLGYRFPNARARYIIEARARKGELMDALASLRGARLRHWLASNIKGIGYKEASHFLRNIGHTEFAIIDFHILDALARHGIIRKPRHLSPGRYAAIEERISALARECGLSPGELDLYLWYMETKSIMK
jgi:N-glycosylase/DNA lyase